MNNENETEEETEVDKKVRELSLAEKDYWLAIYSGLATFERFKDFIKNNFEVQTIVDEENKKYEVRVIEKPLCVGPKLSANQIFKMHGVLSSYGVKDLVDCTKNILKLLGQESSPLITSENEGNKLISLNNLKKNLD